MMNPRYRTNYSDQIHFREVCVRSNYPAGYYLIYLHGLNHLN